MGPGREVAAVADASRLALPGDLVEIDAGVYSRDVAIWSRAGVTVRASGGRVRMDADGAIAEDKAIWVVRAKDVTIEGIDFSGAHASDGVGAGIRFERGRLTVRDCAFLGNEIGLLTANRHDMELTVDRCEFAWNRSEHDYSHQLYVGRIARLPSRRATSTRGTTDICSRAGREKARFSITASPTKRVVAQVMSSSSPTVASHSW